MERKLMALLRTACNNSRSIGFPSACSTSIFVSTGEPSCAACVSMIQVWPALASKRKRSTSDCLSPALDHRSEEHTSELQSRLHLVCRLLLEKKKTLTGLFEYHDIIAYHSCYR